MASSATVLKPNILVAPLDWGLGHATRCIPVIKCLLQQNCNVFLAGESKTKSLLEKEFPQLKFLNLKGYRISYSSNKWTLPFAIASQIPKIISVIKEEEEWLKNAAQEYGFDAVISDNRYGLHLQNIPCVFITHQLKIKTPFGRVVEDYLQQLNYNYINQFTECWVPDYKNDDVNLAGKLSHPVKEPNVPVKYLGPLSRFSFTKSEKEKNILILLSGPEPQRTIFEKILIKELEDCKETVVFVRGLPGDESNLSLPKNISVHNHLSAAELEQKISEAKFVIACCGYSTVMDLAVIKKKSILIPTPGQSEQEYLAKHLQQNNFALCVEQSKFKLKAAIELAENFNYQIDELKDETHLASAVKSLLFKSQFKNQ